MNPGMPLTAVVEVPPGQTEARTWRFTLRVTNGTGRSVTFLDPDLGFPTRAVQWTLSLEAYRTFLLLSFGFLTMSVTDEAGSELGRREVTTSATPALRPPLELAPGDALELTVPVGELYDLEPTQAYRVALELGDRDLRVAARATLPPLA